MEKVYYYKFIILGIRIYPNKDIYEGAWENGKRAGKGIYQDIKILGVITFSNGNKYEGDFILDAIPRKLTCADGSTYEGDMQDGMLQGKGNTFLI